MNATPGRAMTNGTTRGHYGPMAVAGAPYDDPMTKVLGLDAKTSGVAAWFGFTSAGTVLMVWFIAMALVVAWWRSLHPVFAATTTEEIDILRDETPPPPPPPPTAEPKPEPTVAPARVTPREAPPPPPAPAQAAKVLTQEPKPDEPVDLTGNAFVTGNADAFAGGFTAGNGTSTQAVHTQPSPTGVPNGTGAPQAPPPQVPKVDKSRKASVGATDWHCPFPPEADTAQVDEAVVMIQVDIAADGSPTAVKVLSDPGNGFGREARRCAMSHRYVVALDEDGNPVAGTTKANVRFSR